MKTRSSLIIGIIIAAFGSASFGLVSYLLDHGYLVGPSFVYPPPVDSQFNIEVMRWGIFAYLRIGFLIIGYSGVALLGITGIIHLRRKRK